MQKKGVIKLPMGAKNILKTLRNGNGQLHYSGIYLTYRLGWSSVNKRSVEILFKHGLLIKWKSDVQGSFDLTLSELGRTINID